MNVTERLELALLTVAGALLGILCCGFLMIYLGSIPFPITALVAGVGNLGLLWLAGQYTESGWRFAPLGAWTLVVVLAMLPGLHGSGQWISGLPLLLILALGLGIPSTIAARFP
ncbi:hypothetical protein GOHSU_04_01010 [Gordonia hirsuta DSM 44140 = NBRC 16056]|uniref:Uncharacterized protein n=1 Tax=Gordonia hirsuta DSM 44140 = NBRC 16056 TaxID=1121927 RepID=L7L853_9ACTN|nr:hypothetical protein [Gordonia hirsuta]GAC56232.1 hypothetical protein GOHSU_04_01010 [Gordonia hirsuta DSM 44140 = NBRC 16056]